MKNKVKISGRERWVLAFAPTVLILAAYFFGIQPDLVANLDKEQKRIDAASTPVQAPTASSTLAKAKMARDAAQRDIADRETKIAQLEVQIASFKKVGVDEGEQARVIEQVEAAFFRNGITSVTSEQADHGDAAVNAPAVLLDVLAPRAGKDPAGARREGRVWHFIFDDHTPRFQHAMKDLAEQAPSVVPLSFNLVYNPANQGESRLLELWLLY